MQESCIERHRRITNERFARWRARQSQETLNRRRARNSYSQRIRRETQRQNSLSMNDVPTNFIENEIQSHNCGAMNAICEFCKSINFAAERPTSDGKFTSCCRKGKIKLMKPTDTAGNVLLYPDFLRDLMSSVDHPDNANFKENIRSYNSALSFASMGAKIVDFHDRGPYILKFMVKYSIEQVTLNLLMARLLSMHSFM